jgi:hypothetical protein
MTRPVHTRSQLSLSTCKTRIPKCHMVIHRFVLSLLVKFGMACTPRGRPRRRPDPRGLRIRLSGDTGHKALVPGVTLCCGFCVVFCRGG